MEITVRIFNILNNRLEIVADETGIPKSSLILYAINHYLRSNDKKEELSYISINNEDISDSTKDTVRFTLRIPEHIKALIDEQSSTYKLSRNKLLNMCIYYMDSIHWKGYLHIDRITK